MTDAVSTISQPLAARRGGTAAAVALQASRMRYPGLRSWPAYSPSRPSTAWGARYSSEFLNAGPCAGRLHRCRAATHGTCRRAPQRRAAPP